MIDAERSAAVLLAKAKCDRCKKKVGRDPWFQVRPPGWDYDNDGSIVCWECVQWSRSEEGTNEIVEGLKKCLESSVFIDRQTK
jgi:hypothetical protein